MIKIHYVPLILIGWLASVALGADDALALKEFTSKAGRFTVLLPGVPVESKDEEETIFLVDHGTKAYMVRVLPHAPRTVTADSAKRVLEASRDAVVTGLKAKLLSTRLTKVGKIPAMDFQAEMPDGNVYRARLIESPSRFYQLLVIGPKADSNSKAVESIYQSFKPID